MARLRFLSFTCYYVFLQLQQAMASPPPLIEAYKPTTSVTTTVFHANRGVGTFRELGKILSNLQHKMNDINARRKFMEAQMRSPYAFLPTRMEAALDYTNTLIPSIRYFKTKIVSANGVFLQIFPDGTANGTRDDTSPYGKLPEKCST